jgi:phosphocarrier protein HPr
MAFERRVQVGSSGGLHARPAAVFVRAAAAHPHRITIGRPGGDPVVASSILSVLGLHVASGEEVILTAEDEVAVEALDELSALLVRDLDREE